MYCLKSFKKLGNLSPAIVSAILASGKAGKPEPCQRFQALQSKTIAFAIEKHYCRFLSNRNSIVRNVAQYATIDNVLSETFKKPGKPEPCQRFGNFS